MCFFHANTKKETKIKQLSCFYHFNAHQIKLFKCLLSKKPIIMNTIIL